MQRLPKFNHKAGRINGLMKTRNTIIATLIPLALVCVSPAWADTTKTWGTKLTITASLVNPGCLVTIEGGAEINLNAVTATGVKSVASGAMVPSADKIVNVTLEQCGDAQYALRFTGSQASDYPEALTNEIADGAKGVGHYLKYIDAGDVFYPNNTFLGDGSASAEKHMDMTSTFTFQLEAGYMRLADAVTSGKTSTTVTLDVMQN